MTVRSALGSLQLPTATAGTLLLLIAAGGVATFPSPPPESEGFVAGLAVLLLYVLGWVGFMLLAAGLAIPPGDGYGIRFTRAQRWLFLAAAAAAALSAVGPFIAFALILSNPSLAASAWLGLMGLAVASLLGGLAWRVSQALLAWRYRGGSPPASD